MERLFGRSKAKKSTSSNQDVSPASPSNAAVTNEDEGFSIVTNNPAIVQAPQLPSNMYPVLTPALPNGTKGQTDRQTSVGTSALDGIPFTLSSKCSGGNDLDEVLARVENIAERIRNVDWSTTEYDFRLEKSVISQDTLLVFSLFHSYKICLIINLTTLKFLINVLHFFFGIFSYLHGLIRTYTFIYFWEKFPPTLI